MGRAFLAEGTARAEVVSQEGAHGGEGEDRADRGWLGLVGPGVGESPREPWDALRRVRLGAYTRNEQWTNT